MFETAGGALPDEMNDLRRDVRFFLEKEQRSGRIASRCDSWLTAWDADFSRKLGERGWIGMTLPARFGGAEAGNMARFVVAEELLAVGAPVAAHWIADRQSGPSILRFGTDAQRAEFLPGIVRGETYFAIGMSEPDSGSDLASLRTRAVRCDRGWRVNGTKTWTSGAHLAHAMITLVRTDPLDPANRHAGLSQFIVDLSASGVTINPIRLISGEHHFNEVVLQDVFVPDERVLGQVGDGWLQVTSELAWERSGPERILSTFPLLTATIDCLRARRASPTPSLGAAVASLWSLRQMSLSVATLLDAGRSPEVEAALVKDLGTRFEQALIDVSRSLIQLEPDQGAEAPAAALLAQAVMQSPGFTLRGGTNEILRGVLARGLGLR